MKVLAIVLLALPAVLLAQENDKKIVEILIRRVLPDKVEEQKEVAVDAIQFARTVDGVEV